MRDVVPFIPCTFAVGERRGEDVSHVPARPCSAGTIHGLLNDISNHVPLSIPTFCRPWPWETGCFWSVFLAYVASVHFIPLAVAKTSDLIIIMMDATKSTEQRKLLEIELDAVGIRLNKKKPDIVYKRKTTGGVSTKYLKYWTCTHIFKAHC